MQYQPRNMPTSISRFMNVQLMSFRIKAFKNWCFFSGSVTSFPYILPAIPNTASHRRMLCNVISTLAIFYLPENV